MTNEELEKLNGEIEMMRRIRIDATSLALRHRRGFRRWVLLRFAAFGAWAERWGKEYREEQIHEYDYE